MIQSLFGEVWDMIRGGIIFMLVLSPFVGGYMLYENYNTVYVKEVFLNNQRTYTTTVNKGNESTCSWTFVGGNAAIPYKETTTAYGEVQNHYIAINDYYDWAVVCTDNLGHTYSGKFLENDESASVANQDYTATDIDCGPGYEMDWAIIECVPAITN